MNDQNEKHSCVILVRPGEADGKCQICGRLFLSADSGKQVAEYELLKIFAEAQASDIHRLVTLIQIKDLIIAAGTGHYQKMIEYHAENLALYQKVADLQECLDLVQVSELPQKERQVSVEVKVRDKRNGPPYGQGTGDISDAQMGELQPSKAKPERQRTCSEIVNDILLGAPRREA